MNIEQIVDSQVSRGSRAAAITDHGLMTGCWFLWEYITNAREGIKPILGLEAYLSLTRDELFAFLAKAKELEPDVEKRKERRKQLARKYHQILLAINKTGYYNLVKIHNDGWIKGYYYSPTTVKEVIFEHSEGLIATTACLQSVFCQYILANDIEAARREIEEWKSVFGDRFYIELQTTNLKLQSQVNDVLIDLARKTNTPIVVTNDVHYLDREDNEFHKILLNMTSLKEGKEATWEWSVTDLYMKSVRDMYESFKAHHDSNTFTESVFYESIDGVYSIIDRVEHYDITNKPLLPHEEGVYDKILRRAVDGLATKIEKGVIPRNKIQEYKDRLVMELRAFRDLGALDYINVFLDIVDYCDKEGIFRGPARGSAAGSLALYLLNITHVDPLRWGLLFERFLNKNRRAKLKF